MLAVINYLQPNLFEGSYRFGIKSLQLFYTHQTILAGCMVALISLLIVLNDNRRSFYFYFAVLLCLMCLTLRSKAVASAIAFVFLYYFAYVRKKKITVKTLVMFIPLLIAVAWDQIMFYFFSDIQLDSARYQLLYTSVKIANDYFPLGSGFGTFGSAPSGKYYSLMYSIYGIDDVNGLRPGYAIFVSDSFWPMILGQFGWIGLFAMLFCIRCLFRKIQKVRKISNNIYVGLLILFVYILIASTAESAFVHPNSILYAILMGCYLKKADILLTKE